MAKIYEAHVDHDAVGRIAVAPPKREDRWIWGLLFVVFLVSGVVLGVSLATGSLSNTIELAQATFAAEESSETATN
ncbi:MAG: hypothetical protein R3C31_10740 [Hyphomonadaceae bacterium]